MHVRTPSETTPEGLRHIRMLYGIEGDIRRNSAVEWLVVPQDKAVPLLNMLKGGFVKKNAVMRLRVGKAFAYAQK